MLSMFDTLSTQRNHYYFVFSTGTKLKSREFATRLDAERYMHDYCAKNKIVVECTEYDKHERKYSNHKGIRFYINRI